MIKKIHTQFDALVDDLPSWYSCISYYRRVLAAGSSWEEHRETRRKAIDHDKDTFRGCSPDNLKCSNDTFHGFQASNLDGSLPVLCKDTG
ncbi:hypothetical protein B296_00035558 [Ensete ventricosum]|uniref:Uncharacterized protein n=1 Tax=Ensete ventricosum TaxID=4639 RepID=A0A426ZZH0_ENSVE|nr:hypothetical protein B296_00035558 [Ensete ventricosum]